LLVAGVFFGLLTLNRPNAGLAAGGVLIALLAVRRWRGAAALAIGMTLAVAPVAIRNVAVARQFALVSSQGGLNFYIGNRAEATGQYLEVPGVRPDIEGQAEDTRIVAERAVGHRLSDAEVSRYFAGEAFAWMRERPGAAARLFVRKLALVFNARHQWLDFSYPYYAYDTGSFLWLLFVGPWLLVPLGVAAWCVAPRSDRTAFYVWASFVPAYAASLALFFVAERYRTPLWPPLAVAAGGAVAVAWRDDRWKRALAAAAVAAIVTFLPFQLPDGRFEERQRLAKVLMNRHDYSGAAAELERALVLQPSDTGTEFALGMAQVSAGRKDEGIDHLRQAIDHGVAIPGARYALANVLLRTGDTAAAVRQLRSFSPEPSDSAESCFQVAMLAIDAGENDVARRYLRRALELKPGWPDAQQVLAQLGGA
jgi:tetratricopeptide (TPR) repeat protein